MRVRPLCKAEKYKETTSTRTSIRYRTVLDTGISVPEYWYSMVRIYELYKFVRNAEIHHGYNTNIL